MSLSSPHIAFDDRLLAIEELVRQRQYTAAARELAGLSEDEFSSSPHEFGLILLLKAQGFYQDGQYSKSLEYGHRAAKLLADFPLNRRYGSAQLVLSKSYSALGDLKNAEIRARDALASFRRGRDSTGQVDSLNELARISAIRCDYVAGVSFLSDAVTMCADQERKVAQLTGNLGTLRICTGEWQQAENELTGALEYNRAHGHEISQAINLLSLAYLRMRRRQFILARHDLDNALEIASRLGLKREKVLYLKFAGELAFERGDLFKAKSLLADAYQKGILLAPVSALVSQACRRLAEAELALENSDEAMKWAQKALELSLTVGEKVEVGLSRCVIARVFAARGEADDAFQHIENAVQVLREVGDPYELGRTLLVLADIHATVGSTDKDERDKVKAAFEEAGLLFRNLGLDYWTAQTDFKAGVFECQQGRLAAGFKKLSRAEKEFATIEEHSRVRAVHKFLQTLSDQAVALSVSSENEFKMFGSLITPAELSHLKSGQMEEILEILLRKTAGSRAILLSPDSDQHELVSSLALTAHQAKSFSKSFRELVGQEVSRTKPTLILDCRRDPFINDLFSEIPDVVSSVIVVPFKMGEADNCFLYVDRLTEDNSLDPFNQDQLNFAVGFTHLIAFKWAEVQKNRLLEDNLRLKSQLMEKAAFPNIITQNPAMLDMLAQVRQVVNSNISVLIEGETGSGKDLLARAVHFNSNRREKRFISVNCAALPETLLESELFGYKRGAFTGADRDKAGLFEEAHGGTFFLDEIADMPLSIQAKILRILEAQEIVRLGETVPRKVDVRILSATNRDLKEQMNSGLFRQDLYYRLTALTFRLPPLRERREDIPLLVAHFLEGSGKTVAPELMKLLVTYDWPGNIRQLENEVKKLALLAGDKEMIESEVASARVSPLGSGNGSGGAAAATAAGRLEFSASYSLYDYLAGLEKQYILKALREKHGIKKHAAAVLNIPESTLRLKIKQYGINVHEFAD